MLIVYDSLTGNVQRFISKLTNVRTVKIEDNLTIDEPYVLVTYTFSYGNVPESTANFLKGNGHLMRGVAASGNRNWGDFFGRAGKLISEQYQVPLLATFELSGTQKDLLNFNEGVMNLDRTIYHTIA